MSACPALFEPRFRVLVCCRWRTNHGRETWGANRYRVCARQVQDAFHRLAGELLDVCGCQPDIDVCLPQKGFRDGGGGGEAFGDGARPIAPRDAVASQPAPGRTVSPPVGCDVVFPLRSGLGRLHADLHRLPRPSTESVRSVKTTQRPLDDIEHPDEVRPSGSTPTDR